MVGSIYMCSIEDYQWKIKSGQQLLVHSRKGTEGRTERAPPVSQKIVYHHSRHMTVDGVSSQRQSYKLTMLCRYHCSLVPKALMHFLQESGLSDMP